MNKTQIIDYQGDFVGNVSDWMETHALSNAGFEYALVAVLGCQSSGKSTLLNALFGTDFDVMNASSGRTQTTKGLWLAKDTKGAPDKPTLIVDVEGTDSRERGEDRLTFEHRAALFSLAVADCLIVNMWYNDIGRYTASNYGLLKTVMEVNLELFHTPTEEDCTKSGVPRTVIVFVIRDYSAKVTPIAMLEKMILEDIRSIWEQIRKPDCLKDTMADDYFEFRTMGLSSLLLEDQNFARDVQELRKTYDSLRPSKFTKNVPADGFGFYCQSIWRTIVKESSLDIPSQKEMLATFRCEEIKALVISSHQPQIQEKLGEAQQGTLTEFKPWASGVANNCIAEYTEQASRYEETICEKKRSELLEILLVELQGVVDAFLSHVRQRYLQTAQSKLELEYIQVDGNNTLLGGVPKVQAWENFTNKTNNWMELSIDLFNEATSDYKITLANGEECAFNTINTKEAFIESLTICKERMRERQMHEFRAHVVSQLDTIIGDETLELEDTFTHPDFNFDSFWIAMSSLVSRGAHSVDQKLHNAWMGLGEGESISTPTSSPQKAQPLELLPQIAQLMCQQMTVKMHQVVKYIHHYIQNRFMVFFSNDEDGVPRQWQTMSPESIKDSYLHGREKALDILSVLKVVNLDAEGFLTELDIAPAKPTQLISEEKAVHIEQRASKAMQNSCKEALVIQGSGSSRTNIPMWMYLLLAVLGYNEVTTVLTSPFFMFVTLIIVSVLTVSYFTGNIKLPLQMAKQGMIFGTTFVTPILQKLNELCQEMGQASDRPKTSEKNDVPKQPDADKMRAA